MNNPKITFVSNYINHHQIPVSDELYKLTGGEYVFIQTEPMEEERIRMGWDVNSLNKPYVKLFYEDEEACRKLIMDSDCVIFGGTEREELIIPRLEAGRLTIRYSERIYKDGRWKFVSPRGLKKKYHDHIRFNKSNVYMLCSGAYVKGDFSLIHAYPKKMLKYGYFPEFVEYSLQKSEGTNDLAQRKNSSSGIGDGATLTNGESTGKCLEWLHKLRATEDDLRQSPLYILWAARFIDWKHPEVMVELAKRLAEAKIPAKIHMIGSGELLEKTISDIAYISDTLKKGGVSFSFDGSKTPAEVRESMRRADVFISTSDRKEGWGAVVNEAMNSGCVTIAAREIGAAPYLIQNEVNGFTYKACDIDALFGIVNRLQSDRDKCLLIGEKAYETIKNTWNAKVAAKRLFEFIKDDGKNCDRYEEGPLSRA